MAKKKEEYLKIPCVFDDYKLKKSGSEMVISFAVAPEHVDLAKPLMNHVAEPFVLLLVKLSDAINMEGAVNITQKELEGK